MKTHTKDDFIGSWTLISWDITYSDSRVAHPFGKRPIGQLLYAPDGGMSATVCRSERALFELDITKASDQARLDAFGSYFHYAGYWHIESDHVVHDVKWSLNPNMVGTQQRRHAQFDHEQMTLSADEMDEKGRVRHHCLKWQSQAL